MASVPKPLKFPHSHYGALNFFLKTMGDSDLKHRFAEILSVLALTMSAKGIREPCWRNLRGVCKAIDGRSTDGCSNVAHATNCCFPYEGSLGLLGITDPELYILDKFEEVEYERSSVNVYLVIQLLEECWAGQVGDGLHGAKILSFTS